MRRMKRLSKSTNLSVSRRKRKEKRRMEDGTQGKSGKFLLFAHIHTLYFSPDYDTLSRKEELFHHHKSEVGFPWGVLKLFFWVGHLRRKRGGGK